MVKSYLNWHKSYSFYELADICSYCKDHYLIIREECPIRPYCPVNDLFDYSIDYVPPRDVIEEHEKRTEFFMKKYGGNKEDYDVLNKGQMELWKAKKTQMEKDQEFWDKGGYIWCEKHGCWNTNKRCNECSDSKK